MRSSLNWGPLPSVTAMFFGWQSMKQKSYADDFHTYTLEWTGSFMRFSVDSRLKRMLDLRLKKKSFFEVGNFPSTVQNGSTQSVVPNPWSSASNAAPFDQQFYLILDLAVGGTSGWFPDGFGGKMWFDGSNSKSLASSGCLLVLIDFFYLQPRWWTSQTLRAHGSRRGHKVMMIARSGCTYLPFSLTKHVLTWHLVIL